VKRWKRLKSRTSAKTLKGELRNEKHYGTTVNETEIYDEYVIQSEQYMKQDKRNQKRRRMRVTSKSEINDKNTR